MCIAKKLVLHFHRNVRDNSYLTLATICFVVFTACYNVIMHSCIMSPCLNTRDKCNVVHLWTDILLWHSEVLPQLCLVTHPFIREERHNRGCGDSNRAQQYWCQRWLNRLPDQSKLMVNALLFHNTDHFIYKLHPYKPPYNHKKLYIQVLPILPALGCSPT